VCPCSYAQVQYPRKFMEMGPVCTCTYFVQFPFLPSPRTDSTKPDILWLSSLRLWHHQLHMEYKRRKAHETAHTYQARKRLLRSVDSRSIVDGRVAWVFSRTPSICTNVSARPASILRGALSHETAALGHEAQFSHRSQEWNLARPDIHRTRLHNTFRTSHRVFVHCCWR
jgi:hypothetical protein